MEVGGGEADGEAARLACTSLARVQQESARRGAGREEGNRRAPTLRCKRGTFPDVHAMQDVRHSCRGARTGLKGAHIHRASTRGNTTPAPSRLLPRPLLSPKHHSGNIMYPSPRAGRGRGRQQGPYV